MSRFSREERHEIIRSYFSSGGDFPPLCLFCGGDLDFAARFSAEISTFQIRVSCPDCRAEFTWEQNNEPRSWKPLHLQYFLERVRVGEVPRCPVDDCDVVRIEHSDGFLEFRCPFCNRRGRIRAPENLEGTVTASDEE